MLRVIINRFGLLPIDTDSSVGRLTSKDDHVERVLLVVTKVSGNFHLGPVEGEVYVGIGIPDVGGDTVVQPEVAFRGPGSVRGDDQVEGELTVLVHCHGFAGTEGNHRTASDMKRHCVVADIINCDRRSGSVDCLEREEIVEERVGDVDVNRRAVLNDYRRDEKTGAVVVLAFDVYRLLLLRVNP